MMGRANTMEGLGEAVYDTLFYLCIAALGVLGWRRKRDVRVLRRNRFHRFQFSSSVPCPFLFNASLAPGRSCKPLG